MTMTNKRFEVREIMKEWIKESAQPFLESQILWNYNTSTGMLTIITKNPRNKYRRTTDWRRNPVELWV